MQALAVAGLVSTEASGELLQLVSLRVLSFECVCHFAPPGLHHQVGAAAAEQECVVWRGVNRQPHVISRQHSDVAACLTAYASRSYAWPGGR